MARLGHGITAFGGWTAGRTLSVSCDTFDPNLLRFCDQTGKLYQELGKVPGISYRHDFKAAGSYSAPFGLIGSVSLSSFAGALSAGAPGAGVDALGSLGVAWTPAASVFPGGQRTQSVTVPLIAPGTKFLKRLNQLDLSLKKTIRLTKVELEPQFGLYNALNSSVVLTENQAFGTALGTPQTILIGRLPRLALFVRW